MARPALPVRSSSPWGMALVGIAAGLLLALAMAAPARWLAAAVARASAGQLLLNDPRGTVWNGSAQLVLTGGQGSQDVAALPTRMQWRLRPAWAGLNASLSSPCCTPQPLGLGLRLGWGSVLLTVEDGSSNWPAALLTGLGTPWNTLQIEGNLHLLTKSLSVEWTEGRPRIAGAAELTALRVSSRLSTLRPMGSYRITLLGGDTPRLQLSTLEGSLRLSGSGQWVGSRLRFRGEASAAPEREAALSNLLNIIGRRSGPRSIITIG